MGMDDQEVRVFEVMLLLCELIPLVVMAHIIVATIWKKAQATYELAAKNLATMSKYMRILGLFIKVIKKLVCCQSRSKINPRVSPNSDVHHIGTSSDERLNR